MAMVQITYTMDSPLARTGRHKQRYIDQFRLVAGCIPYKIEQAVDDHQSKVLVLMISTPNRHDLVFPKGGWEDDETIYEAACREAMEEAGVKGILDEYPLGVWEFRSKSAENRCSSSSSVQGGCRGYMFTLEVTQELEYWPEQATHTRRWVTTDEAFNLCRYDWMQDALTKFLARRGRSLVRDSDEAETHVYSTAYFGQQAGGVHGLKESSTNCVIQA